jgi:hypothetical protein
VVGGVETPAVAAVVVGVELEGVDVVGGLEVVVGVVFVVSVVFVVVVVGVLVLTVVVVDVLVDVDELVVVVVVGDVAWQWSSLPRALPWSSQSWPF